MTEIIEQMKFCNELQKRLSEAVIFHENRRNTINSAYHSSVSGSRGIVESGASKTQIMASIVQLRRELNTLSRMFDDYGDKWRV